MDVDGGERPQRDLGYIMEGNHTSNMSNSRIISLDDRSINEDDSGNLFEAVNIGSEQEHADMPPGDRTYSTEDYIRALESQNEQFQQQELFYKENLSATHAALQESYTERQDLEAQLQDLEKRNDDAVATLFRLRPQRQECAESEIKQDYHMLKISIESWVEKNCGNFLDSDQLGFDMIERNIPRDQEGIESCGIVLKNFRSHTTLWNNAKDQLLIAVIMRYAFDCILKQSFPLWLDGYYRSLLYEIQITMEKLKPKRDRNTLANWTSDTIASLYRSRALDEERVNFEQKLVDRFFNLIRSALPNPLSEISALESRQSLLKEVIKPSLALSKKIQCASSLWEFKYSSYWRLPPGQKARDLPKFFNDIAKFQCVNLAANRKVLKPDLDLASKERQESMIYILDVFPGLFCSRVDTDKYLPTITISQPVLLVGFTDPAVRRESKPRELSTREENERKSEGSSIGRQKSTMRSWLGGS